MNPNNLLNKKAIIISGAFGSGKTTILNKIYNYFMNLIPIEKLDKHNEEIIFLLENIEFDDSEVVYFSASKEENLLNLLYENLIPLMQRINFAKDKIVFVNELEECFNLILENIKAINPNMSLIIMIDEFEYYLNALSAKRRELNLLIIERLVEITHQSDGLKLILAAQTIADLPKRFLNRFTVINISNSS